MKRQRSQPSRSDIGKNAQRENGLKAGPEARRKDEREARPEAGWKTAGKAGGGRGKLFFLLAVLLAALGYSGYRLLVEGMLSWHLQQKEYHSMVVEILLLLILFSLLYGSMKKMLWKAAGTLVILSIFLWGCGVFLPVAVSGLYIVYLTFLGCFFNRMARGLRRKCMGNGELCNGGRTHGFPAYSMLIDGFLAGCLLIILVFCLMSAVGVGAIGYLQLFVLASGCFLVIFGVARWSLARMRRTEKARIRGRGWRYENEWRNEGERGKEKEWSHEKAGDGRGGGGESPGSRRKSWLTALCIAFIATMLCIQAGRMNTALDFDSLWYGVRAPFILDNGRGIYENLGTIGVVYTYSKGWEVMTLPLSNLPSYSFLISFNLWLSVFVLLLAYRFARFYMEKGLALFLVAALSSLPGIMNMAITTKTDMATLLFQEIMLYYLLRYLKEGRFKWKYLAFSGASFFMTWTLKPTALVFSTAIFGMSLLFLIIKGLLPLRCGPAMKKRLKPEEGAGGGLAVLLLSLCSLGGIWLRTLLITGLPVTSVFSSALTKLGFRLKYPFQVSGIPNSGARLPLGRRLADFGKRIFEFLLCPLGEDMDHVILAWGGFLLLALLIVWIFCLFIRRRKENEEEGLLSSWLLVIFVPFLAVCGLSLFMLVQVDGNYFMLLYVLTGIVVFHRVARLANRGIRKGICVTLIPVLCFGALMASLTNWSWTVGFPPLSFRHFGYYDHLEAEHQRLDEAGNGRIWDILAENPRNRLIAIGDHPGVLAFACSAQSYDDITGTWGNVALVKTMDRFVAFMGYAKTDYVYAQAGYMGQDERCYSLVRDLIQYGKLVPVCYEEGNLLARVDIQGEHNGASEAALKEFESRYEMAKANTNGKE